MGSASSRESAPTSAVVHEQLLERLRALDLKHRQQFQDATALEKGYIFVDENGIEKNSPPLGYCTPLSRDISIAAAEQWEKELLQDPKNRLALSAFSANAATSIITSRAAQIADTHTFNLSIPLEGNPVTYQRTSGRCWLFATTNVLRIPLMKKYNLKEFQLSQAYLYFWDKLEKTNYFLENIIKTAKEPLDGRLVQQLLSAPVNDGGQWDMALNLVEKYGVIPQILYPDSYNAMNSAAMNTLLTTKLREDAIRLRALATSSSSNSSSSLTAAKTAMLREIHLILTVMLGPVPNPTKEFSWEYKDADGKYHKQVMKPTEFAQGASNAPVVRMCGGVNVHTLFSLVNDPRNEYETLLSVDKLGNIYGARPVRYVNVKISTMKEAAIAMLKKGHPVFFGCDVGKYSDSSRGIMDTALYDYELGFNIKLGMSKAERLQSGESSMTHAMVLTAVQIENGKSIRWRVENSWNDTVGDKGYFVMTDTWFDQFTYQVVVDPSVVSDEIKNVLKTKPKILPLWDPMGALA